MQKIIPHLWFNTEAKEAADFYTSLFPESAITNMTTIRNTPSGDCDVVSFTLWGYACMAISAGPLFQFNPSISFLVNFDPSRDADARARLDAVWAKLSDGGKALMPLGEYPFSAHYGWVQDRYGLSWQLMLTNPDGEPRPPISPFMLFTGAVAGKAEEATNFYCSIFRNTQRGKIVRYPAGMAPEHEGSVMFTDVMLEGQWFAAMDSAYPHGFAFNEALSFMVRCKTQEEIDYYWNKLSAVPEAEQCGWCKDKYGVSWQIVPTALDDLMRNGTREQIDRVTQVFLRMKKFDIAALDKAAAQL